MYSFKDKAHKLFYATYLLFSIRSFYFFPTYSTKLRTSEIKVVLQLQVLETYNLSKQAQPTNPIVNAVLQSTTEEQIRKFHMILHIADLKEQQKEKLQLHLNLASVAYLN